MPRHRNPFFESYRGWKFMRTDHLAPGRFIVAVGVDSNGDPEILIRTFNSSCQDKQFNKALSLLRQDADVENALRARQEQQGGSDE